MTTTSDGAPAVPRTYRYCKPCEVKWYGLLTCWVCGKDATGPSMKPAIVGGGMLINRPLGIQRPIGCRDDLAPVDHLPIVDPDAPLCIECGTRPAAHGMTRCQVCTTYDET